jgi:hypothetical protein
VILSYGQGHAGNMAIGTPSGGGTFPAPGSPVYRDFIEDSDDSPAGGRATYGSGGVPSPPGPGPGWQGALQQLALVGGTALIARLFGQGDSRSTKGSSSSAPPTPTSSAAMPSPGFAYDRPGPNRGTFPDPVPASPPTGGGFDLNPPLILAVAAAAVLLLFMRR